MNALESSGAVWERDFKTSSALSEDERSRFSRLQYDLTRILKAVANFIDESDPRWERIIIILKSVPSYAFEELLPDNDGSKTAEEEPEETIAGDTGECLGMNGYFVRVDW